VELRTWQWVKKALKKTGNLRIIADGHPYPVNREMYNESIQIIQKAILKAKIGRREKIETLKRLNNMF